MQRIRRTQLVALLLVITLGTVTHSARSQTARVGDLVEYVSGLGPTLAEIVVGPDAAGYVVIQVPTGKQLPVNTQKLRLVQPAGTPNANIAVGEAVSWTDADVIERGKVVKVHGDWCQVATPNATTVGWIECKSLRTAAAAKKESKPDPGTTAGKPMTVKLQGDWENADGTVKLEFQAAGKCYISLGPMTSPCTYKQADTGVKVNLEGEDLSFVANDDGSLSSAGDPAATMAIRLKKK